MILDKRILPDKKPLSCLDAEQAIEFVGKECYFSDLACQYDDLGGFERSDCNAVYRKGILSHVNSTGKEHAFENKETRSEYRYCLPCEWVKEEKKYRPYKNVQELFDDVGCYIGDVIHFRSKANETENHALITSYTTLKNGTEKICLGGAYYYTTQALFDSFELRSRGEWVAFGKQED